MDHHISSKDNENIYNNRKRDLPSLPWIMKQTWIDSLFIHYPVKREVLQKFVPDVLPIDTFEGVGWISIVPYLTSSMRLRGIPPAPGIKQFPGYNVRTYVNVNGRPGIYFFSLTAANWFSATAAKIFFRLPYYFLDIHMDNHNDLVIFNSKTLANNGAQLICNYKPNSKSKRAERGSLDEWLIERYCLFTVNKKGAPLRCNILHHPWLLQDVEVEFQKNTTLSPFNIIPDNRNYIMHYSKRAEVRIWPLVSALN